MIEAKDLQQAITECNAERKPNYETCMRLAAYYYLYDRMQGRDKEPPAPAPSYSYAAEPVQPVEKPTAYESDTEFAQAASGVGFADLMPIIDELMEVLQAVQPRLYNAVMRKIAEI